jgi:precorrin-8X/cobalt-precorrin-8 methylmutase
MYVKDPGKIESTSMDIIENALENNSFSPVELTVVKRMIHTTGDFDYQHIVSFMPGAVEAGIEAVKSGCRIVTDTRMVFSGINKRVLERLNCRIDCYIDHEEVFTLAKEKGITRSMAAMELASQEDIDIAVIGNAPTALYRIGELIQETRIAPELIIGVPVGFVGAAEAREFIRGINIPSITTIGTKGGSNVAAAVMNAIIYMAVGKATDY